MKKVINPVKTVDGQAFVKIEFKDDKLSISGVIAPRANGDCGGSCGQIVDELTNPIEYNSGWTRELTEKFQEVWKRWHLNDLTAGSPRQEAFVREWRKNNNYEYSMVCNALEEADLLIDSDYNDYRYGSAWLMEEIPEEVIEFLKTLPSTPKYYAWV